jgi:hypothetical protein
VRSSIRHLDLHVDIVDSVEKAEAFCRDALPHGIVYEAVLANLRFRKLCTSILAEFPSLALVEIAPEGDAFQLSNHVGGQCARLGRDAIAESLASALVYELTRVP